MKIVCFLALPLQSLETIFALFSYAAMATSSNNFHSVIFLPCHGNSFKPTSFCSLILSWHFFQTNFFLLFWLIMATPSKQSFYSLASPSQFFQIIFGMLSLCGKFLFFVKFSHDVFGPLIWQLCVLCMALSCFICMVAPCFLCGSFCSL
jgi:hypothetical protein